MGKPRVIPDQGQICECPTHPLGQPSRELTRVFYHPHQRSKFCYEWWCAWCQDEEEIPEEWDEGWPQGEDGRFMAAVHCPMIPGLD